MTRLEIFATITLLLAAALTAYNIYPENLVVALAGNAAWVALGIKWEKLSVIAVSGVLSIEYLVGMAHYVYR